MDTFLIVQIVILQDLDFSTVSQCYNYCVKFNFGALCTILMGLVSKMC